MKNHNAYISMIGLFVVALLAGGTPAMSQATSVVEDRCMEEVAEFGLNCTANDVQLAGVAVDPVTGDPLLTILDDGCAFPGDDVTFQATFEVVLTAQARHDVGIYFATDGDENGDGAITGECSISTIPYAPEPFLDLDMTDDGGFCDAARTIPCESDRHCKSSTGVCAFEQDTCGDIDSVHSPLYPVITITTECIDPDGNRMLNLPNCTSWRQPGANELCTGPLEAFPGAPSKCRCDQGFEVPILVPPAQLLVTKTANPDSVQEPGGSVTFSVEVVNLSPFAAVTLNSLTDSIYNDITTTGHDGISATTCSVPQSLPAEDAVAGGVDTYSCSFTAFVAGQPGSEMDVVTASGVDENDNAMDGSDDATVVITDVPAVPLSIVKSVTSAASLPEPGGDFDFQVIVTNDSSVDTATVTDLDDTFLADLQTNGSCVDADADTTVPWALSPGESLTCTFTVNHTGMPQEFDNRVTVAAVDDDGANVGGLSNIVTVGITDLAAVPLRIVKSVTSAPSLPEPGGDFDFQVVVTNDSTVDAATVTDLDDTFLADLQANGSCTDEDADTAVPWHLSPGESLTCTFTVNHTGEPATFDNLVTVTATDDDGGDVGGVSNIVTVQITDVAPAASMTKTAAWANVTYQVSVTNDSGAEALTLTALTDNRFGNVADAGNALLVSTTCSVPQTLQPKGDSGDTYSCSFVAKVNAADAPHTNILTATVTDDDEPASVTPSDSATVNLVD